MNTRGTMVLDCLPSVCWVIRTTFLERALRAGTNDVIIVYTLYTWCTSSKLDFSMYFFQLHCLLFYTSLYTIYTERSFRSTMPDEQLMRFCVPTCNYSAYRTGLYNFCIRQIHILHSWRTGILADLPGRGGISAPQYCCPRKKYLSTVVTED